MSDTMKAVWTGGRRFVHTAATGHEIVTDTPEASGGTDTGPTPMELVLLGVLGCTGVDVAAILEKMQQPLEGLEVEAAFERADDHPRVYTRIHLTYRLKGDLDPQKVQRAIELSEQKYCSASAMVRGVAEITHEFVIGD